MARPVITLEQIDEEHRRERANDEERLRTGEVTARELQEENTILPARTKLRLVDFASSLERAYSSPASGKNNPPEGK